MVSRMVIGVSVRTVYRDTKNESDVSSGCCTSRRETVLFIDCVAREAGFRFSLANEVGTDSCGVIVSQPTL